MTSGGRSSGSSITSVLNSTECSAWTGSHGWAWTSEYPTSKWLTCAGLSRSSSPFNARRAAANGRPRAPWVASARRRRAVAEVSAGSRPRSITAKLPVVRGPCSNVGRSTRSRPSTCSASTSSPRRRSPSSSTAWSKRAMRRRRNGAASSPRTSTTSCATASTRAERATAEHAWLVLPDGMPIVWASRLLGRPLTDRLTGADLFAALWPRLVELRGADRRRGVERGGGQPARHGTRRVHRPPDVRRRRRTDGRVTARRDRRSWSTRSGRASSSSASRCPSTT